ncbi:MAG: bifunctional (p)ppGpp synthetase/guanosine-3',5'-bis(diphosphate) 3'-pyrophosphohydrolase [Candidatus Aminicenantes bacterium]|nr:MAG: bifunctional (p)ppGpp synthetase/guanosine-3',5'-bis(diphosphate) 3'-pyrophosphohydrolase [Candidatus Aminicenantes bacterium]
MIKRFFELQEKVLAYYSDANIELLKKAYSVAAAAHLKQKRATNEPFIIHPLEVAGILADMRLDEISIAGGLLHDVVEDSDYTIANIESLFGKEIAGLVEGVTKISKISEFDSEAARAETLKKMIIAMTNDVRVILIKLADRYHNILTLDALSEEKREKIAKETLEIYAPIAYRLCMGKIKTELEDIAFKYAYPKEYREIEKNLMDKKEWAFEKMEFLKGEIKKILKQLNLHGNIYYRMKREISIYRKLMRQNISFDQVYDLLALRIITDSIENCYALMGEIHQRWTHLPSRFRDFIANQKSNGYQSIHSTIITPEGIKFEIQIRTNEMHKIAEEGIAAHWKYKEGISFIENDQRLQWFRDMIETHKENPNPRDFLSLVKGDLTPNEIYVFTPKGKVINLKVGATSIDFAYAIHSEIGEHCQGAIVNEHLVPLRTQLNSGDVVEILTAKNAHPSIDWLKHVVTNRARKKIMAYIQRKEHAEYFEKGKRLWARILREYKKKYQRRFTEEDLKHRIRRIYHTDLESFLRALGSNNRVLDKKSLQRLFPEVEGLEITPTRKPQKKNRQMYKLVNVDGFQDIDVSFARCCSPIKGDKIVGYVTQKRGLVIHREDCANLKNVMHTRRKKVEWNDIWDYQYQVKYDLLVHDKPGLLNSISGVTAKYNSNIIKVENERISQATSKIKLIFEVKDTNQLNQITEDFNRIKGIYSIDRKRVIT